MTATSHGITHARTHTDTHAHTKNPILLCLGGVKDKDNHTPFTKEVVFPYNEEATMAVLRNHDLVF